MTHRALKADMDIECDYNIAAIESEIARTTNMLEVSTIPAIGLVKQVADDRTLYLYLLVMNMEIINKLYI